MHTKRRVEFRVFVCDGQHLNFRIKPVSKTLFEPQNKALTVRAAPPLYFTFTFSSGQKRLLCLWPASGMQRWKVKTTFVSAGLLCVGRPPRRFPCAASKGRARTRGLGIFIGPFAHSFTRSCLPRSRHRKGKQFHSLARRLPYCCYGKNTRHLMQTNKKNCMTPQQVLLGLKIREKSFCASYI